MVDAQSLRTASRRMGNSRLQTRSGGPRAVFWPEKPAQDGRSEPAAPAIAPKGERYDTIMHNPLGAKG
jgi:hypothetical protein